VPGAACRGSCKAGRAWCLSVASRRLGGRQVWLSGCTGSAHDVHCENGVAVEPEPGAAGQERAPRLLGCTRWCAASTRDLARAPGTARARRTPLGGPVHPAWLPPPRPLCQHQLAAQHGIMLRSRARRARMKSSWLPAGRPAGTALIAPAWHSPGRPCAASAAAASRFGGARCAARARARAAPAALAADGAGQARARRTRGSLRP